MQKIIGILFFVSAGFLLAAKKTTQRCGKYKMDQSAGSRTVISAGEATHPD